MPYLGTESSLEHYTVLGPQRITVAPNRQMVAPIVSQRSGRMSSTVHINNRDEAM